LFHKVFHLSPWKAGRAARLRCKGTTLFSKNPHRDAPEAHLFLILFRFSVFLSPLRKNETERRTDEHGQRKIFAPKKKSFGQRSLKNGTAFFRVLVRPRKRAEL
jgi:hypothetical protein